MRFHHAQSNLKVLGRIAEVFKERMEQKGLLPRNPWRAKRVHDWLATMGARMKPGSRRFDPDRGLVDCENFLNFQVSCPPAKTRIRGERGTHFMRIEIPWELADKILVLGHLP